MNSLFESAKKKKKEKSHQEVVFHWLLKNRIEWFVEFIQDCGLGVFLNYFSPCRIFIRAVFI
jgi:hypothetical protein